MEKNYFLKKIVTYFKKALEKIALLCLTPNDRLRACIIKFIHKHFGKESLAVLFNALTAHPNWHSLLYEQFKPNTVPTSVLNCLERAQTAKLCYGQEGEDAVLRRFMPDKQTGFYVDIGAHHPVRFSNTWRLYQQGWRGINIDATPGSMEIFVQLRPDDINIEAVVSDNCIPKIFFSFEEPALNTLDEALAKTYIDTNWKLKERIKLTTQSLSSILDAHLPDGTQIDILSIDVEGHELNVFKSNNWCKYKPQIIIVEILDTPLLEIGSHPIALFLKEKNYIPISKLYHSVFFIHNIQEHN